MKHISSRGTISFFPSFEVFDVMIHFGTAIRKNTCKFKYRLSKNSFFIHNFTLCTVYYHSPSARDKTNTTLKYLVIFHADLCNKSYI